ncbi:DNA polymerase iota isoform X1 [Xyrauchen texanus]|uniref:DNA polymerase iota isoform X1 n=1 Tax=Xyrauchen texanus TaxID=154827 RepID=UPI002241D977|nr:DNA polymerase iota isoform X1 [Xyrauchen texanus]XP_051981790.1 DNA polymerase iota isoform X1 [Xyrauchen texanus]
MMDMDEGEDNEWDRSLESDMLETECTNRVPAISHRVILHFDQDCFYAQVEMIRNPALRNKPLGIQQKYIIVTCNYVARELGVTKLMSVTDAVEKCPQLVLVNGEDLTHYREMSYKVTELLMSYCPLVERLGFDENFVDITEMVERRLKETCISDLSFNGHVYKHKSSDVVIDEENACLAVGSMVAAELRQAMFSTLGLTGCAGIANSKLLAKLVSGTFKPNQQTTLLPYSTAELMSSLTGLRRVPGIGYRTGEKLKALGLVSVQDLQLFPLPELVKEFGEVMAKRIQNLACGNDDSPVTPAGPPQSLSDEDSFKKISTLAEVTKKIEDLLISLTERMYKDGRQPHTFRLTIRKYSATNRWFNRESRQCPIPNHTGLKITCGSSEALPQLLSMAMKLFHKVVDLREPFHLTLLNVCFSNLQAKCSSKRSIVSFFAQKSPAMVPMSSQQQVEPDLCESFASSQFTQADVLPTEDNTRSSMMPLKHILMTSTPKSQTEQSLIRPKPFIFPRKPVLKNSDATYMNAKESCKVFVEKVCSSLPPDVDPEVFKLLPEHIQMELISSFQNEDSVQLYNRPAGPSSKYSDPTDHSVFSFSQPRTSASCESALTCNRNCGFNETCSSHQSSIEVNSEYGKASECCGNPPTPQTPQSDVPPNVDPYVFSQLPVDVQRDLQREWRQQKSVLKIPTKHSHKTSNARDKRTTAKDSQCNNILKYFKPN